jgi:hypothetical protein
VGFSGSRPRVQKVLKGARRGPLGPLALSALGLTRRLRVPARVEQVLRGAARQQRRASAPHHGGDP